MNHLKSIFSFVLAVSCIKNPFTSKTSGNPQEILQPTATNFALVSKESIASEVYVGLVVAKGIIQKSQLAFVPNIQRFGGSTGTITPFANLTSWKCKKEDKELSKETCENKLSQWMTAVAQNNNHEVNFNLTFSIEQKDNSLWQQKLEISKYSDMFTLTPTEFVFYMGEPVADATLVVRQSALSGQTLEVPLKFDPANEAHSEVLKKILTLHYGPLPTDTAALLKAIEHRDVYELALVAVAAGVTSAAGGAVVIKGGSAGGRLATNLYKKGVGTKLGSQLRAFFENKTSMKELHTVAFAQSIQDLDGKEEFLKFRDVLGDYVGSAYVANGVVTSNIPRDLSDMLYNSFAKGWGFKKFTFMGHPGIEKDLKIGRYRGLLTVEIPSKEVEQATSTRLRVAPVVVMTKWPQNAAEAQNVMEDIKMAHKALGRTPEPEALKKVKDYIMFH